MVNINALFDVVIRTKNSERGIGKCLASIRRLIPDADIIVIDGKSTDNTVRIAESFASKIIYEDKGLSFATGIAGKVSTKDFILFIDSDVELINDKFPEIALNLFKKFKTGAVVGNSLHFPFNYGLPLGLTMIKRHTLNSIDFPENVKGRETYYIQSYLRKQKLKVRYVNDSMIHTSYSREYRYWPEWQGAYVRLTAESILREYLYSLLVVFLMLTNSRNIKNFLYIPVYWIRLTRGFVKPHKWDHRIY